MRIAMAGLSLPVTRRSRPTLEPTTSPGSYRRGSAAGRGAPGPAWAAWNSGGRRYTIGIEEEAILIDRSSGRPAQRAPEVLRRLSLRLAGHVSPETHASVLEFRTGTHEDLGRAISQLRALRRQLVAELERLDLAAASVGLHPLGTPEPTRVSDSQRYRMLDESLRSLARREPTAALHVHVGIPSAADAVRVLNRFREVAPILLALSANSPFCAGRDTGFASARTIVFGAFPRTGLPRFYDSYAAYVAALDPLIDSGAVADPTFLWWDVRLQPGLGTVEVRVMDAQAGVGDTAALVALIRSLARLELTRPMTRTDVGQEVLAENRFLAARDGLEANLIDPTTRGMVPVREVAADLVTACRPHAAALGCADELDQVFHLIEANGCARQRRWAHQELDLSSVVATLVDRFAEPSLPNNVLAAERSN